MVNSHCPETGPGMEQGLGIGSMGSNILLRNVYTGQKQRQVPEHIVSCCASPNHRVTPGPGPIRLVWGHFPLVLVLISSVI